MSTQPPIPTSLGAAVAASRSRVRRARPTDAPIVAGATMTPMIDVVFLLIIFFMLVAQITRQQVVELDLPNFTPSAAVPVLEDGRLVLNIVPRAERIRHGTLYIAGGLSFAAGTSEEGRLVEVVRATAQRQQSGSGQPLEVLLRASDDERYAVVHNAMDLVRQAGIGTVHLMTLDESTAMRVRQNESTSPGDKGMPR